jgi:hypothetical protein
MVYGTFIFVHDQQIILDFERINKFSHLENVTYVYLGKNQTDLIENKENVFICKNQTENLEEFPRLTSFTGWFAIWKSQIYKKYDFINLFEYDVNLSENFFDILKENSLHDVISYIEIGVHDRNFLKTPKWSDVLLNSLNKKYGGGGGLEHWFPDDEGPKEFPHPSLGKYNLEFYDENIFKDTPTMKTAAYLDMLHGMKADKGYKTLRDEFNKSWKPSELERINTGASRATSISWIRSENGTRIRSAKN